MTTATGEFMVDSMKITVGIETHEVEATATTIEVGTGAIKTVGTNHGTCSAEMMTLVGDPGIVTTSWVGKFLTYVAGTATGVQMVVGTLTTVGSEIQSNVGMETMWEDWTVWITAVGT